MVSSGIIPQFYIMGRFWAVKVKLNLEVFPGAMLFPDHCFPDDARYNACYGKEE